MRQGAVDYALEVVRLIEAARVPLTDEKQTQVAIAELLTANRIPFAREYRLSAEDIPDFLVADYLAVEVKIKGQPATFSRQLARYASHAQVSELVLVTGRAARMPETINGKRVLVASLGKGWL